MPRAKLQCLEPLTCPRGDTNQVQVAKLPYRTQRKIQKRRISACAKAEDVVGLGAADRGARRLRVHVLLDGRDVEDGTSVKFVAQLQGDLRAIMRAHPDVDARIASGGGRMRVTMDRYEVGQAPLAPVLYVFITLPRVSVTSDVCIRVRRIRWQVFVVWGHLDVLAVVLGACSRRGNHLVPGHQNMLFSAMLGGSEAFLWCVHVANPPAVHVLPGTWRQLLS